MDSPSRELRDAVLTLRPIKEADWSSVHEWASTRQACRYQSWGPNTVQETQQFVKDATRAWDENPQTRFVWIAELEQVGVVGMGEVPIRSQRWLEGEIAYAVHTGYWGLGIATAIGVELVRFAFDSLRLHRVTGTCDPRNEASAAVLRKLGMTWEGRLRHTIELRGGWRDSEVFSVLADEPLGLSQWTTQRSLLLAT